MNNKINKWKDKALERRIKIWAKEKRIKELTDSRDNWKARYMSKQAENKELHRRLKGQGGKVATKVRHHSYSSDFISLCLNLRTIGGCSLRGCLKVLEVLVFLLEMELGRPSASSIRNWEIKMGYHKVHEKCGDGSSGWALIIDESVSVGSQKVLLLLGVKLGEYKFGAALQMADVEVLSVKIKGSWRAEDVDEVIRGVENRQYSFEYCCCDNGNNLRKVLKMNNLVHIEDCGHCLGKILEKKYKKDERYISFCREKSLFQKQNLLSKYAALLPPKQRTKGRYMNLGPTVKWAAKVVKLAKGHERVEAVPEATERLKWLLSYEDLIDELYEGQLLVNQVNKILKENGLSTQTAGEVEKAIQSSTAGESFCQQVRDYVERNLEKLPGKAPLICSSDIIESMFGKFKNSLSDNSMAGLTEGSLNMANYGKKISPQSAKEAMEKVKMQDIEEWRKENLPVSLLQQKARLFRNTG